jgi:hypothetical protein
MVDRHNLVGKLLESNILSEEGNLNKISLHSEFVKRRDELLSHEKPENVTESIANDIEVQLDLSVSELSADAVAVIATLNDVANDLSSNELLTSILVVQQIECDDPTTNVPMGFIPLNWEYLPIFQNVYSANVLFCWREDCSPCEEVKSDFEDLRESDLIPDGIGLGALYGSSCSRELQEKFDVTAAPTILFCIGNKVDSRIVGSYGRKALQAEMTIINEKVFQ